VEEKHDVEKNAQTWSLPPYITIDLVAKVNAASLTVDSDRFTLITRAYLSAKIQYATQQETCQV